VIIATMIPFRRHTHDGELPIPSGFPSEASHTTISLSPGLETLRNDIAEALGDAYRVTVGHADTADVALVGTVGVAGIRFLTLRYPRPVLVVVDTHRRASFVDADEYIAAGAARYVLLSSTKELARQIELSSSLLLPSAG
jgi:hypothetical protein